LIVLDTSVVLAFMDRDDTDHERVREWMEGVEEELCTTPLVLAELDHLIPRKGGPRAAEALRASFESGAYTVEWWRSALRDTIAAARLYESIDLGLTDASLIALAAHLETTRIATLDERHFRAVQPLTEGAARFTILPADEAPPA
jgi:predicted nucleic acid-binding protein